MSSEQNPANSLLTQGGSPAAAEADASNELSALIEGVLQQTQDRFQSMSDQIIRRIDDMTKRIDDLEKSITDLIQNNQLDAPPGR